MKSTIKILPLVLAVSTNPAARADESVSCKVRALFPGQTNIAEALSHEIGQTKSTLLLALFGFNDPVLGEELKKLAERGVKVSLKIDAGKSAEKKESQLINRLKGAGVSVQAVAPDGRNHNKFAVIDDSKVITGSYNWTVKAKNVFDNLLILDCPELAKKFRQEWESIR
ncbi:MAG TPA: phospholipase D-like domain-containing protein [Candidatus Acidoferrales bacterium]|nr:phospholipase D-like domain-containing protein [Candidatus Acidoferrales bacterium]